MNVKRQKNKYEERVELRNNRRLFKYVNMLSTMEENISEQGVSNTVECDVVITVALNS